MNRARPSYHLVPLATETVAAKCTERGGYVHPEKQQAPVDMGKPARGTDQVDMICETLSRQRDGRLRLHLFQGLC